MGDLEDRVIHQLRFLTPYLDDRVIFDIMNDVLLPKGRYPEKFVLISQLEVCQEGGLRRGYLEHIGGS